MFKHTYIYRERERDQTRGAVTKFAKLPQCTVHVLKMRKKN